MLLRLVLLQRLCVAVKSFCDVSLSCMHSIAVDHFIPGFIPHQCAYQACCFSRRRESNRMLKVAAAFGFLLFVMHSFSSCQVDHFGQEVAFELIDACTIQDEFLELMLPMVSATIRGAEERGEGQADPAAALDPSVAKALRRRQRGVSRKKVFAEADTVFKVTLVLEIKLAMCA